MAMLHGYVTMKMVIFHGYVTMKMVIFYVTMLNNVK